MRPMLLIAGNFLRQMRWLVLIYPLIAIAFGVGLALASARIDSEELQFYFTQIAAYAVGIATFLAAQANLNERKSRRILGVLSKGIERRQYLAGLLTAVFASSALFVAGALIGTLSMASHAGLHILSIFGSMLLLWLACCLSAALAMFLSTFLHPLLAAAGALMLIGAGWTAEVMKIPGGPLFPVYQLIADALQLLAGNHAHLATIPVAVMEIFALWLLAGWVFERRDIAVAIE